MIYAFLRQFSGEESLLSQRAKILSYAQESALSLDSEMIEFDSAKRPLKERDSFQEFLHTLKSGDEIIIDTIETLGSCMEEVVVIINCMLDRDIKLHIASQKLQVDHSTGLSQLLPLIVRLKDEPNIQTSVHKVGRPKGRRSASKFDIYLPEIVSGLKEGESVSAIARRLGVSRSSLKDYIESRQLKKILDDSWLEKAKQSFRLDEAKKPSSGCTLNEYQQKTVS